MFVFIRRAEFTLLVNLSSVFNEKKFEFLKIY